MTSRASERAAFVAGAAYVETHAEDFLTSAASAVYIDIRNEATRRYPDDASPSPGEMAIEALRTLDMAVLGGLTPAHGDQAPGVRRAQARGEEEVSIATKKMASERYDRYETDGDLHWKTYAAGKADPRGKHGAFVAHMDALVAKIEAVVPVKSTAILDVGCGDGLLLGLLRERGYTYLQGLEPEAKGVELAHQHGLEVVHGNCYSALELARFAGSVVILSDVIEHLMWPEEAITAILEYTQLWALIVATPEFSGRMAAYHFREFGMDELCTFLRHFGLSIAYQGYTVPGRMLVVAHQAGSR